MSPDCLFCKIIAGDIPSRQVYADDTAIAFLDLGPWSRGHTLVVPRDHVADLLTDPPLLATSGRRSMPPRGCWSTSCTPTGSTCCPRPDRSPARKSSICTCT